MTPEERSLVVQLFDRLTTVEDAARDPEAERLVADGLRQAPNAPYALVQTVLVQDEALRRANSRIQELEKQPAPSSETSFLGNMRATLFGSGEPHPSVPSVRPLAPTTGMSGAWRSSSQTTMAAAPATAAMPNAAASPMGGSFLGTAASAAAGVIGGALLLDGIRSMMGHHGAAHGAFDSGAYATSPWSTGTSDELSRQAGIDDIGRNPDSIDQSSSSGLLHSNAQPSDPDTGMDDLDDGDISDAGFDVDDSTDA